MIKLKRPRWHRMSFATWNFGPGDIGDLADMMKKAHVIALQETGDRIRDIMDLLHRKGWKIITGAQPGQASTPLIYNPRRVELIQSSRILLAHAQDAGPGTGPDRIKEKWLIGGLFRDRITGRTFWAYGVHMVTSQGKPKRRKIALAMVGIIRLRIKAITRAIFIGGDWNTVEQSDVMQVILEIRHMRITQTQHTHDNWSPDHIVWRHKKWMRYIRDYDVENGSDHDGVVLDVHFKAKKGWPKEAAA